MSLSSRELNYLVWRYLQESGFELSAYALQNDTPVQDLEERLSNVVARGSLVDIVQRGLQYLELESKVKNLDTTKERPYTLLKALTVEESIHREVKEAQLRALQEEQGSSKSIEAAKADKSNDSLQQVSISTTPALAAGKAQPLNPTSDHEKPDGEMDVDIPELVVVYSGAYEQAAQFNPTSERLAAVANDVSSDIWQLADGEVSVTNLLSKDSLEKDKNTTSIRWNRNGRLVAQGSFEGKIRVWTVEGKLKLVLDLHTAPVMVLRWNTTDTLLLSLDCNNNVIVWDAFSGDVVRSIKTDSQVSSGAPSSVTVGNDAVWIDSSTFAVTSDVASIAVYKVTGPSLNTNEPLLKFRGHSQGINSLDFDETTQLLCSSSDDHTVRIWYGKNSLPVSVLSGHRAPVIASKWVTNPKTLDGIMKLTHIATGPLLLSASLDGTLKLWDPATGKCITDLELPGTSTGSTASPLFCLEISSNGKYLAAGGYNGMVYVWDIESLYSKSSIEESAGQFRKVVAIYKIPVETEQQDEVASSDSALTVNLLSWSPSGALLLAGYSHKTVVLQLPSS